MMAQVAITLGGNRNADRSTTLLQRLLQVPAPGLEIHAMIGGDKDGRIGSRCRHLAEEVIQPRQMFLGLGAAAGHMCIG
jgi:hypothetical protein